MTEYDEIFRSGDSVFGFMVNGRYVHAMDRTWERISDEERAEELIKLKCDNHPDAKFQKWEVSELGGWVTGWDRYREFPIVFHCQECIVEKCGLKTTEWHYCYVCGMVKGTPKMVDYKSSPSSWANLAGREGTHTHCLKCNVIVGYWYHTIS